jgi:hypothetical protein
MNYKIGQLVDPARPIGKANPERDSDSDSVSVSVSSSGRPSIENVGKKRRGGQRKFYRAGTIQRRLPACILHGPGASLSARWRTMLLRQRRDRHVVQHAHRT